MKTKTIVTTREELGRALRPPIKGRQVSTWIERGMPGTRGHYCVEDSQKWLDEHATRGSKQQDDLTTDPALSGPVSPALERYREARAKMVELDLMERSKVLIHREMMHETLGRIARRIRGCGEELARRCGNNAVEILNDTLEEIRADIEQDFADAEEAGIDADMDAPENARADGKPRTVAMPQNAKFSPRPADPSPRNPD